MTQLQLPFDNRKRKPRPAIDQDTNDLTRDIIQHIRKLGGWATRVNVSGFYDPEKGFWRKGVTDPGTPDVMAVVNGLFLGIEIKTGADRLRPQQTAAKTVIQRAGGVFLVAKDIEQFRNELRTILQTTKGETP